MDAAPQTKRFSGSWLLYRKAGAGLSGKAGKARLPRYRYQSFEAAEAEARRLLTLHPDSTFIIMQECARVKLKPVESAAHA